MDHAIHVTIHVNIILKNDAISAITQDAWIVVARICPAIYLGMQDNLIRVV
jgi:hypothetical protein